MKLSKIFFFPLLLLLTCCVQSPDFVLASIHTLEPPREKGMVYSEFWEAAKNASIQHSNLQLSPEEEKFSETLELIFQGDYEEARYRLFELVQEDDPQIQEHSFELLGELLFLLSDWKHLNLLTLQPNTTTSPLLKLLHQHPKQAITYPDETIEVPMTLTPSGIPQIELEINGKKKVFWIDTGAKLTVLSSDTAKECGIVPLTEKTLEAGTSTSKNVEVLPTIIPKLQIDSLLIQNHPALILDESDLTFKSMGLFTLFKIDGLLGWNALQHLSLELDYLQKKLSIHNPKETLPSSAPRNLFWAGCPIVRVQSEDGTPLHFGFDSGSSHTFIRENIFQKVPTPSPRPKTIRKIGGAGGWEKMETEFLSNFGLIIDRYLFRFENISTILTSPATFIELDGTLGSDVAFHGKLFLDFPNGQFQLYFPQLSASQPNHLLSRTLAPRKKANPVR